MALINRRPYYSLIYKVKLFIVRYTKYLKEEKNLKPIVFIDTEIEPKSGKILDIGGIKGVGSSFHSNSMVDFAKFLYGSEYVCGHNIFNHDLKYIRKALIDAGLEDTNIIDTLFLLSAIERSKGVFLLLSFPWLS